jgi:hypothetical protein
MSVWAWIGIAAGAAVLGGFLSAVTWFGIPERREYERRPYAQMD